MENEDLRIAMAGRNGTAARAALTAYLSTGRTAGSFNQMFGQAIENGEGIVGYQYLHGTNTDVGGLGHSGSTVVTPLPDGIAALTIYPGTAGELEVAGSAGTVVEVPTGARSRSSNLSRLSRARQAPPAPAWHRSRSSAHGGSPPRARWCLLSS